MTKHFFFLQIIYTSTLKKIRQVSAKLKKKKYIKKDEMSTRGLLLMRLKL
jgi:hypothetical protein